MSLGQIYRKILDISSRNHIEKPMIVGGIPRDLYLGDLSGKDVDLTTNDADCPRLGLTLASDMNFNFKMFEDGHVSIYTDSGALDFSGNFTSEKAVDYAGSEYGEGRREFYEVYSRDFTMNTMHKELLSDQLLDLTGLAEKDLEKKIVRVITTADICFGDDLRRLFRAVNFSARLGFAIDGEIIDYARANIGLISREMGRTLRDAFVTSIIGESISNDPERTLGYLLDMGILSLIPLTGSFKEELIKRKMIARYLDGSISLNDKKLKEVVV